VLAGHLEGLMEPSLEPSYNPCHHSSEARRAPISVRNGGGLLAQPAQVPAVNDGSQYIIVKRRSDLPDAGQTYGPGQPPVPWHLRPKHQKRRYPRGQLALTQHIKAPGGRISIKTPMHPCVRVQIVEPDRQAVAIRILRVVPDLKVTDRAARIVKDGG
jgi:hypothetical protein